MKSLNDSQLALLLDLLGKRPDLSVSQVENLHTRMQQQAQQEKKKTAVKWRKIWKHVGVSVAVVAVALFLFWISGAKFERGAAAMEASIMMLILLIGFNGIAASTD